MAQASYSLFRRIRCIKSSLDKAEQSFLENKSVRGELDLMLAEAELKNLRQKKNGRWSWNRQLLACSAAAMLALAGFGGWYVARDYYQPAATTVISKEASGGNQAVAPQTVQTMPVVRKDNPVQVSQQKLTDLNRVHISQADMRRLVQSAKVELSNSK